MKSTQVFEWFKAFSGSIEVVENLSTVSCPTTSVNDSNIEEVEIILHENCRVGIRGKLECDAEFWAKH